MNMEVDCSSQTTTKSTDQDDDMMSIVLSQTETMKVDEFFLFNPTRDNIETLENRLKSGEVKIKKLRIKLGHIIERSTSKLKLRVTQLLHNILISNQNNLEQLKLEDPLSFLPELEIPILPNLKLLICDISKTIDYYMNKLPCSSLFDDFTFERNFPNLNMVNIKFADLNPKLSSPWIYFLPLSRASYSCSRLEVRSSHLGPITEIETRFPYIQHLTLWNVPEEVFIDENICIWGFEATLSSIELHLNVRSQWTKFPYLDTLFTGFSEATVRKVGKNEEFVTMHRINGSLVEMKELRRMTIIFEDVPLTLSQEKTQPPQKNEKLKDGTVVLLSWVTAGFAFNFVPLCQIDIFAGKSDNEDFFAFEQKVDEGVKQATQLPNVNFHKRKFL